MRLGYIAVLVVAGVLAGCSGTIRTSNISTPTVASGTVPSGSVSAVTLTDIEIAAVRRDVPVAFADPTRPLIDTIAGAQDAAGNRYACGNVYGNGVSGLPYAGRFTSGGFQLLAKGGTTVETRAAEDLCGRLGIRPRRIS